MALKKYFLLCSMAVLCTSLKLPERQTSSTSPTISVQRFRSSTFYNFVKLTSTTPAPKSEADHVLSSTPTSSVRSEDEEDAVTLPESSEDDAEGSSTLSPTTPEIPASSSATTELAPVANDDSNKNEENNPESSDGVSPATDNPETGDSNPSASAPQDGNSEASAPEDGNSEASAPEDGNSEASAPEEGNPEESAPEDGQTPPPAEAVPGQPGEDGLENAEDSSEESDSSSSSSEEFVYKKMWRHKLRHNLNTRLGKSKDLFDAAVQKKTIQKNKFGKLF